MEAPEKIYLVKDRDTNKPMDYWYSATTDDSRTEYTRTDAFIKKATKWLIDNIQNYTNDGMGEHSFVLVQDLKEDFKKYMEG